MHKSLLLQFFVIPICDLASGATKSLPKPLDYRISAFDSMIYFYFEHE